MFSKPEILLVDDDPSCLQVLISALSGSDYQLICATKAADAVKLARERRPHLVLLDAVMPEMDGFTMCQQLRADAATKDLAIIFLSSLQEPKVRARRPPNRFPDRGRPGVVLRSGGPGHTEAEQAAAGW